MTGEIKVGDIVSYKILYGNGELMRIKSGEVVGVENNFVRIRAVHMVEGETVIRDRLIPKAELVTEPEKPERVSIGEDW